MRIHIRTLPTALLFVAMTIARPAQADVVIIVSAQSPLRTLSAESLSAIFLGKISALPDGTKVVPLDLSEEASTRTVFYSKVVGKSTNQVRAYWSRLIFSGKGLPPRAVANETSMKALIAQHADWVGYIDESELDASVRRLQVSY